MPERDEGGFPYGSGRSDCISALDQEITERIIATSVARGWRLREISLDKSSLDEGKYSALQLSNHNSRTK